MRSLPEGYVLRQVRTLLSIPRVVVDDASVWFRGCQLSREQG